MVKEIEEKGEEGSKRVYRFECEDMEPGVDHAKHDCKPIEVEVDISSSVTDDNMIRVIIKATDKWEYANEEERQ